MIRNETLKRANAPLWLRNTRTQTFVLPLQIPSVRLGGALSKEPSLAQLGAEDAGARRSASSERREQGPDGLVFFRPAILPRDRSSYQWAPSRSVSV